MASDWLTPEETLRFWEDPLNYSGMVNAVPLAINDPCLPDSSSSLSSAVPTIALDEQESDTEEQEEKEDQTPATPGFEDPPEDWAQSMAKKDQNEPHLQFVPYEDLKKFPYHSIGKLFLFDPNTKHKITYTTAFYIGNYEIMTAAHAFDKKMYKSAVFVPASKNKDDMYGENYGHYPIAPKRPRILPGHEEKQKMKEQLDEEIKKLSKDIERLSEEVNQHNVDMKKLSTDMKELYRAMEELTIEMENLDVQEEMENKEKKKICDDKKKLHNDKKKLYDEKRKLHDVKKKLHDYKMNCHARRSSHHDEQLRQLRQVKKTYHTHDVCILKLGEGRRQIDSKRTICTTEILKITPIKVSHPPEALASIQNCEVTAIGYGEQPVSRTTIIPSDGRMLQLQGKATVNETENMSLKMTPAAWCGMSGCPWMTGHEMTAESAAIGIQSTANEVSSNSPGLTQQLLADVGYYSTK